MGVMAGLMAGATALNMASQVSQGMSERQGQYNMATQYEQQAKVERTAASGKIISDDWQAIQALNRMSSNYAASGFGAGGSEKYVRQESVAQARLHDMYTRYSGKLAASQDVYAATTARYQGDRALAGSIVGAIGTGIQGGMGMYKGLTYGWGTTGGSA